MDQLKLVAEQLGIDETFYYLFGLMVLLYVVLSAVYLKPFQRLLHSRKEKTEGSKKEAQELSAKAEEKFNTYKARLKDVNEKARQTFRASEEQAKKEEGKILADAAMKSKVSLQNTQKELDAQRKATLDALTNDVAGIAEDIAAKVLGRPVGSQ
jgi:F-type H+-transporting ATPase subunit b